MEMYAPRPACISYVQTLRIALLPFVTHFTVTSIAIFVGNREVGLRLKLIVMVRGVCKL